VRSLVVLSGGLDSTVCMAVAEPPITALTFDYGQRHRNEIDHAAGVAGYYRADHLVVRLDLTGWGGSALTDARIDVPVSGEDLDSGSGEDSGEAAIPVTYVPARNLIFLSVAMGVAEARNLDAVYLGVNALDYSGYPDCRPEFVESFGRTAALALKRGVEGNPVQIETPLIALSKADIVRLGIQYHAPLHLTWSCYRGGLRPCRECDACRLRAKGFAEAGIPDPALADPVLGDPALTDPAL
jgi:7-cyano-7-deazaguanine synthase